MDAAPPTNAADVEALWRARARALGPDAYQRLLTAAGDAPIEALRRRPVTRGEPFSL